ncbi:glycerol kinase GlpK [Paracnuella aquatica]|uniref:glycerol kinase GlpK n=1 Tax=Paracnuella aquatica TaxID=2268757 RepID=UPI000DEF4B30|nr:glycerol kinase GlpK [Paracnuella aquatica]RPD50577.1 glycerol kinase [Paracnuella aquatica]
MSLPPYILSLDQGTTSSRALLFNHAGEIVSLAQKEFTQIYPQAGWVEHDPAEIWSTQASVATEAILKAGASPTDIAAIGITNQRETTIVWDRNTGNAICNAIVWQDRRTAAFCDQLQQEGQLQIIRDKTGLVIDAYFSATKLHWILNNVEGARQRAEKGELLFGTVDSWLVWNLTGGEVHITDVTNASRTLLFNIHTLQWDDELLQLFGVPRCMLPEVKSSSELYGHTAGRLLAHRIPIAGIAGDQQAALFGQQCTRPGMVKNTYGTGCFMLMNIGSQPVLSQNNLLTTVAWKIGNEVQYALEGSIFIGGAVVQWLRDGLGLITTAAEVENLAQAVSHTDGVYLVPAFAGLGAPHWNGHARGIVVGLTRGTTDAHLARAALESIAFQTGDVLQCMERDAGKPVTELRVDGGATANNLLMQIQADVLQTTVVRPQVSETTAMGAAFLAGLAVGFWKDLSSLEQQWKIDQQFTPQPGPNREAWLQGWQRAVKACLAWAEG